MDIVSISLVTLRQHKLDNAERIRNKFKRTVSLRCYTNIKPVEMKLIVACVALVLVMQISASPVVITSDVKAMLSREVADAGPQEVSNELEDAITTTEKLDTASLVEVKRTKKSHEAAEYIAAAAPPSQPCSQCTSETDLFSSASFPAHHAVQDHHALQMAHIEAAKQSSQQQFRDNPGYGAHNDNGYGSHQPSEYHGSSYHGAGHQGYGYHGGHHEAISYQPSYQPAYQAPALHAPAYHQTYQTPAYPQSYQAPPYHPFYQAHAYQPAYPALAYPPSYEFYNGAFGVPQPQPYSYPSPAPQSSCGSNLMIRCSPQVQYTSCGGGGYGAQPYSEFSYAAPPPAPAYRMVNADDISMKSPSIDIDGTSKKDDKKADAPVETSTDKRLVTDAPKTAKADADSNSEQRSTFESAVDKQKETHAQQQAQSQQSHPTPHLEDAMEKQKATMMKMAEMAQKMENNKNQPMAPMPTAHQQQQGMNAAQQMQAFMPGGNQQSPYFQPNAFKQR